MEWLDIVDETGIPTGKKVERSRAHREGILHRTSHVWIVRRKGGELQVLLQKRSEKKDAYPGCYDISSAGHIPAGMSFRASAVRELQEELGVRAKEDALFLCGQRRFCLEAEFHGEPFRDAQVSNVYLLWWDWEESEFVLQEEEVSEVRWFRWEELRKAVAENSIPHCIYMEELDLLRKGIAGYGAK